MGKFSHVVLHLFSTGHTAFPGELQLCSLAPVAIQGVHSPVCQSARDQQNYPDLRHHLRHPVTLPKIWAYHTPEGTMAWNRHSRTWNTLKGRGVRHGEITQALIHTGSELVHSGSEQFLHGFDHADLALWASVDLQKAGLEKEASPQVVPVNFGKVVIVSLSILRLTELSLDIGDFLKECLFLTPSSNKC